MQEDEEGKVLGSSFNQVIGQRGGIAGQLSLSKSSRQRKWRQRRYR